MAKNKIVPKTKILIVDDHPIVRQGTRVLIEQETDLIVCAETDNAADALNAVQLHHPNLAIVDISLKGSDGLELTKSIRAIGDKTPILIMSMHDEALYADRVLRAGANGYIMKQEVSDNIISAIRQILSGEIYLSDKAKQTILHHVSGTRSAGEGHTPLLQRLSDRELEVFRLIGKGNGTRQIAKVLHLSVKTIETYRAHIKEKLNLNTATELVRAATQWAGN